MKHLRQLCAGFVLVLALSIPAFAGDMETTSVPGTIDCPGITGDIPCPSVTGQVECPGIMGEIECPGLSLFLTLLF